MSAALEPCGAQILERSSVGPGVGVSEFSKAKETIKKMNPLVRKMKRHFSPPNNTAVKLLKSDPSLSIHDEMELMIKLQAYNAELFERLSLMEIQLGALLHRDDEGAKTRIMVKHMHNRMDSLCKRLDDLEVLHGRDTELNLLNSARLNILEHYVKTMNGPYGMGPIGFPNLSDRAALPGPNYPTNLK